MPTRLILTSSILGLIAYLISVFFKIDVSNSYALQYLMRLAIAAGLYINVLSIDTNIFKKNLRLILGILLIGVPIKILLPGQLLGTFSPSIDWGIAFLAATAIAQIDPIAASKFLEKTKMSKKSETIVRAWSSLDDPVTVLFAFYIFLPAILPQQSSFVRNFIIRIALDLTICLAIYSFVYVIRKTSFSDTCKDVISIFIIIITFAYSLYTQSFLVPATIGLFVRPFEPGKLTRIISAIFYLSVIILGLLASHVSMDCLSGALLAISMFFLAQVIVTLMFLGYSLFKGKDSLSDIVRVMFCHQNGMTAMLLTITFELEQVDGLLEVTLPTILWIALFYILTNALVDRMFPSPDKTVLNA